MPSGYTGAGNLLNIGRDFNTAFVKGIADLGKTIEVGLIRQQTNRQLGEFAGAISQTDPNSPDWAKQAIGIAGKFPLAMQDKRGQAFLAMGAKANAQATQQRTAMEQIDTRFDNQKTIEAMRARRPRLGSVMDTPIGVTPGAGRGGMAGAGSDVGNNEPPLPEGDPLNLPPLPGDGYMPAPSGAADAMRRKSERVKMIRDAMEQENKDSVAAGKAPIWTQRNQASEIARRDRSLPSDDGAPSTIEDFAASKGMERIGNSSYFSMDGNGRYRINQTATGGFSITDAPVSTDPETAEAKGGAKAAEVEYKRAQENVQREIATLRSIESRIKGKELTQDMINERANQQARVEEAGRVESAALQKYRGAIHGCAVQCVLSPPPWRWLCWTRRRLESVPTARRKQIAQGSASPPHLPVRAWLRQ